MCAVNEDSNRTDDARQTIALVDDDPTIRRSLERLLMSAGFQTESYRSAQAFLDANRADVIDLLILDYHMPGKNGLQLLSQLRANNWQVPVVMLSGDEHEEVQDQAIASGATAFLGSRAWSQELASSS